MVVVVVGTVGGRTGGAGAGAGTAGPLTIVRGRMINIGRMMTGTGAPA